MVPAELVTKRLIEGFTPAMRAAMFVRGADGREYYRWIFHPDDQMYRQQVLELARSVSGQEAVIERHFFGFRTASRSMVVLDPASGLTFSLKTSTNRANGEWRDKAQPVRYAESAILANEHIAVTEAELGRFDYVVVMREPGVVMLSQIDQAQIFRVLGEMGEGRTLQLPLFSILSSNVMSLIARKNKMSPEQVLEHIGMLWGRAQAEFVLKTGLSMSSAHSQNFLIELDLAGKFTGRIVFRDFADAHVLREFVRGPVAVRMLAHWESLNDKANGIYKRSLPASFMPYRGLELSANPLTDKIFDGTRRGFESQMKSALGPWVYQQWVMREDLRPDHQSVHYLLNPRADIAVDVDAVAVRVREGMSFFSCRRVHGQ